MLQALVTTAAGALFATIGVLVGGVVTRRAQDRSAALMRVSLVAPVEVAEEIQRFGRAISFFLDQVERGERTPLHNPLSPEEFEQVRQESAQAQVRLVNAIRRSLGDDREGLSFGIGG
ncbi:hypothetical protein [Streptomyces lanatus]|uniref:HAMP domain-containing protein n=1 Tax=Streptomyces lanatus TaxID=66900 RepID=A0ABV1Y7V9_9ACTN|nr:hypothetical protein [Streptomyces lanatus]GHH31466.1 hypothetical protein GCM10018780_92330 [Streptomyces lanatus]